MCKFSIIVPCYNIAQLVNNMFSMLHTDDYKDYEVIFVDDCSKDESYNKMCQSKNGYENYHVYQTPKNGGPGPARNLGMEKATGEYIIFCDSDDIFDISCLKHINEFIDTHPDADFVVSPHIVVRGKKESIYDSYSKYGDGTVLDNTTVAIGHCGPFAKVYKTSTIKDNDMHFLPRMTGEDVCFVLSYTVKAKKIYKLDLIYYKYIMNSSSITHNHREKLDLPTTFEVLKPVYEEYFQEIVVYKFIEGHLMTKAKQMTDNKCKNREIKEWFRKAKEQYPDWYKYTHNMNRSLYRRLLYTAMNKCNPVMIKLVMRARKILY